MDQFRVSVNKIQSKQASSPEQLKALETIVVDHPETVSSKNVKSFVERVGSKGCTFCPSTFKGSSKSMETFEQSQLLALSFDSFDGVNNRNLTFEKIKERAEKYNLPILLAYESFSVAQRKKFGIVFLNSTPLSSFREAEVVQKALMEIFPEAENNCSVLKLYSGGNKVLHFDETLPEIDTYSLLMNTCLHWKNRYGATNYKRKSAEFSRETGIALNERNLPHISVNDRHAEHFRDNSDDKNMTKCIIEYDLVKKLSSLNYEIHFTDEEKSSEVPSDHEGSSSFNSFRAKDLQTLGSACKLYQEFITGKKKLTYRELLGVATNTVQIRGGATKFSDTLKTKSYFDDCIEKYDNWVYYLKYIKSDGPQPCSSFCPYHGICPHGENILSTLKPPKHTIEQIANAGKPLVELSEAWDDFMGNFQEAISSNEPIWHVIKSQTALGKTQAILELLKRTNLRILIVVPTNKLKREVWERARELGIEIIVSPSLHEIKDEIPDHVWCEIQALYDEGKSPMPVLKKAIAEGDVECTQQFKRFMRELEEFNNSEGHAVTTHRRLSNIDVSKYDLVIVDEDIIYSTVIPSRETIPISRLRKINRKLAANDPLAAKIRKIFKKIDRSDYFTMNEIDYSKTYADMKMAVNISALCSAKFFCYRSASEQESNLEEDSVTFINPVQFQENVKYIMLSATADRDICEAYFGADNVKFYECKEAAITGRLNQYGDKAMGRSSMRKNSDIIEKIKKWTGFENTISFKEFHKFYMGDLHFGNCAGCDILKGENIDVIGTPHQPEWIYKLFAYSLGYDIDDRLKPNTQVEHNGFRFYFMTYTDKLLRDIQFYIIESELEQAVGRARLLRCDCVVNLFSDFPLRQATLKEAKYDTE